jgi:hypothetical protein
MSPGFSPVGSGIDISSPGLWEGGAGTFSVPLALTTGNNTLRLSYAGPGQGLGEEGWGISGLSVTGGVPEPATWAMLIVGFGFLGAHARRRRPSLTLA